MGKSFDDTFDEPCQFYGGEPAAAAHISRKKYDRKQAAEHFSVEFNTIVSPGEITEGYVKFLFYDETLRYELGSNYGWKEVPCDGDKVMPTWKYYDQYRRCVWDQQLK